MLPIPAPGAEAASLTATAESAIQAIQRATQPRCIV